MHEDSYLHAAKRLYMTATPRIYDDSSKAKAGQANAVLASMDDESLFGPEFHRLGFGEAVSKGLLTDYKVLVLAVDEEQVSRAFQTQLADETPSCSSTTSPRSSAAGTAWRNAEAPRRPTSAIDDAPMPRAVAFAGTIANSKKFAEIFRRSSPTTSTPTSPRRRGRLRTPLSARSSTSTARSTCWCATRGWTGSRTATARYLPGAVQRPVPVRGRGRARPGRGHVPQPAQERRRRGPVGRPGHAQGARASSTATSSCPSASRPGSRPSRR